MKLTRTWLLIAVALAAVITAAGAGVFWVKWKRHKPPPITPEQAYATGHKYLDERKYVDAYQYFDYAAWNRPENLEYRLAAGRAALAVGQKATALPHFKALWEGGRKDKIVLQGLADCTVFKTREERLMTVLDWLRKLPEGPERLELEGDADYEAGRFDDATKPWEAAAKAAPSGRITTKLALARIAQGKREAALTILQSQRGTPLLDEEGYGLLAALLDDRNDVPGAEAVLAEGAKLFPSGDALRLSRATYFIEHDRPAEAAQALEPLTARSKEPEEELRHLGARVLLAFVRASQADVAGVTALSTLAEGDAPWLEGERLFDAALLARLSGRSPSVDDLKRLRTLLGGHPAVLWSVGREYARAGFWSDAMSTYRSVGGPLARAPLYLVEYAQVLQRSGLATDAFDVLRSLHGRGVFYKASLELYRDLAAQKQLTKEAEQAQKILEERFKDDPAVLVAGGVMALRSGHLAEAARLLEALAGRFPTRDDVEEARLSVFLVKKDYDGLLRAASQSRASRAALAPLMAAALAILGRPAEAEAVYEKAVAERPEPRLVLGYANLLLTNGKSEPARARYNEVFRAQPTNEVARLGLATVALHAGDVASARTHAEAVAAAKGGGAGYANSLIAELDLRQNRPDRALAAANRALTLDPLDERSRFLQGVATLELGRAEEAEAILRRSAAARPEALATQWQLARAKAACGATGEALALVDATLAKKPADDVPFLALRMILLGQSGKEKEAKAALDAISTKFPPAKALLCEAWILAQAGRLPEAAGKLRSKLDDPEVAQAWAEATLRQGKSEDVLQALDPHALDASHWIRLAETARANAQPAVAIAFYRKAMRTDPENPALLNNFAYVSLQLDGYNPEEVVTAARKAFGLMPQSGSVTHTYATALLRTGREKDCVALLEQAKPVTEKSAKLLLVLAQAYDKVGNAAAALRTYTACLKHPDTAAVQSGDLARPALEKQIERLREK
jgi:predicted Zn-dependent protease